MFLDKSVLHRVYGICWCVIALFGGYMLTTHWQHVDERLFLQTLFPKIVIFLMRSLLYRFTPLEFSIYCTNLCIALMGVMDFKVTEFLQNMLHLAYIFLSLVLMMYTFTSTIQFTYSEEILKTNVVNNLNKSS